MDTTNFLHQALHIDLTQHLINAGIQCVAALDNKVYFHSPNQPEGSPIPALAVDKTTQQWKCNHSHMQGNIIDLEKFLFDLSPAQALESLYQLYPPSSEVLPHPATLETDRYWEFQQSREMEVHRPEYRTFFEDHRIPLDFINAYCSEYECLDGKGNGKVRGIGLIGQEQVSHLLIVPNDFKPGAPLPPMGMEIHSKPTYAFMDNGSNTVDVYSRLIDMLHGMHTFQQPGKAQNNVVLLTEEYAFEKARTVMEKHDQVNLYLPDTPTAAQYCGYANWLSQEKYIDQRHTYINSSTITEALLHFKRPVKQEVNEERKKSRRL